MIKGTVQVEGGGGKCPTLVITNNDNVNKSNETKA